MPTGAAYQFFVDDGVEIYPRGLNGGKQPTFVIAKEIYDGFPEHCGIRPTEFQIYQHGYDPELERRGHPLPLHFHWIFMSDDPKVPSAVHCSTEKYSPTITVVRIDVYLSGSETGNRSGGLEAILLNVGDASQLDQVFARISRPAAESMGA